MTPTIEQQSRYWNETWQGRIHDDGVDMNVGKLNILLHELVARPYLARMKKLDIGCGSGIHAHVLAKYNPYWKQRWTGIDLAQSGIDRAKNKYGLTAICGDIFNFDGNGNKYEAFLLLDSLEHFEERDKLGSKIKELAAPEYVIFGNIPLYLSVLHQEGGIEKPMDANVVKNFLFSAGCEGKTSVRVYGVNAFPYMLFEASNTGRDFSKWLV